MELDKSVFELWDRILHIHMYMYTCFYRAEVVLFPQ